MKEIPSQRSKAGRNREAVGLCHHCSAALCADAVKTTANTVSRWETATYKPSIADLEVLARFFGVPMAVFFPGAQPASRTNALISATADLDERDLEEVTLYARFRKAQRAKRRA